MSAPEPQLGGGAEPSSECPPSCSSSLWAVEVRQCDSLGNIPPTWASGVPGVPRRPARLGASGQSTDPCGYLRRASVSFSAMGRLRRAELRSPGPGDGAWLWACAEPCLPPWKLVGGLLTHFSRDWPLPGARRGDVSLWLTLPGSQSLLTPSIQGSLWLSLGSPWKGVLF